MTKGKSRTISPSSSFLFYIIIFLFQFRFSFSHIICLLCLSICFKYLLATLVSNSLPWPMCAAPTDTSFYFFIQIFNYIFTKTVNKNSLIIFLTLLMGNQLKTTSVNLYFSSGNLSNCNFCISLFSLNFCKTFLVNSLIDWLII